MGILLTPEDNGWVARWSSADGDSIAVWGRTRKAAYMRAYRFAQSVTWPVIVDRTQ